MFYPPRIYCRVALLISGVWLLVLYPVLNIFAWDHLPYRMRSNGSDFSQYYSGALTVYLGDWELLYPEPNAELYAAPPSFRPQLKTPLFDPEADIERAGKWVFYPQVAAPKASKLAPRLHMHTPELENGWRYICPPPLALLLSPLALFSYNSACHVGWFYLMCASFFGLSVVSLALSRYFFGQASYWSAVFVILPAIPTWLGSGMATSLYVGNVSPLIGFLIACSGYAFLTNRQILLGVAMIVLILFKGIGIFWCPLLLIGGVRWKTLGTMAGLTVLLNGVTIWLAGTSPYLIFLKNILPKANLPVGMGLQGILMATVGWDAKLLGGIVTLLIAFWIYILAIGAGREIQRKEFVMFVSLAAFMALFNLLNPVVWPHYFSCYLILPFAPWIVYELLQHSGRWKAWGLFVLATSAFCWMDSLFWVKDSFLKMALEQRDAYQNTMELARKISSAIACYVIPNVVAAMVLYLAINRLWRFYGDLRPKAGLQKN